ncbi:hypothetical protein BDZ89DRAFT_1061464 [Hymenopellis radicata]|nr:hypothetical protein BDZ89DRAFT_1061464 [Hymenopellis radicata]
MAYFLPYGIILVGLVAGLLRCYSTYVKARLDGMVLYIAGDEDFNDNGNFLYEVDMNGFGNGPFYMTMESNNTPRMTSPNGIESAFTVSSMAISLYERLLSFHEDECHMSTSQ